MTTGVPDARDLVLDAVATIIARTAEDIDVVLVQTEARRIVVKYPSNPMSISEIENLIVRLAMERKLTVQFR
jgi:hypothetical protein